VKYIITYDIVEDAVRTQVSNYLISRGMIRVQYSVFAGDLKPSELRSVRLMLEELTQDSVSSIKLFSQCSNCCKREQSITVLPVDQVNDDAQVNGEEVNEEDEKNEKEVNEEDEKNEKEVNEEDEKNEKEVNEGEVLLEDSSTSLEGEKQVADESVNESPPPEEISPFAPINPLTSDTLVDFLIQNEFKAEIRTLRKTKRKTKRVKNTTTIRDLSQGPVIL